MTAAQLRTGCARLERDCEQTQSGTRRTRIWIASACSVEVSHFKYPSGAAGDEVKDHELAGSFFSAAGLAGVLRVNTGAEVGSESEAARRDTPLSFCSWVAIITSSSASGSCCSSECCS